MLIYFSIILIHSSRIAKNMNKTNSFVIEELRLILRHMSRLAESFRLEKERALRTADIKELEKLRERSKSIYMFEIAEHSREIRRLKRFIRSDQPGMEEADDLAEVCKKEADDLLTHIVSTPNRLIRVYRAEK